MSKEKSSGLKLIPLSDRTWRTCGDCNFFTPFEDIGDLKYGAKRGRCSVHDTIERNLWEKECEDISLNFRCCDCKYFNYRNEDDYEDDYDDEPYGWCYHWCNSTDERDEVCEMFKKR